MRAVFSLLVLLFSMCGAQTQSTQTEVQTESQSTRAADVDATQLDIYVELRELRGMVVELRVTQNELQNTTAEMEFEVKTLKMENAGMKERLVASETKGEALEKVNAAQETELIAMKSRLAATETDVVNLENKISEQPKVAFSAALGGNIAAGNAELNLVYTRIFTNVGQAYSSTTGFFTAPARGVYYFRFTATDILQSHLMQIKMFRNGERIMYLGRYDTDAQYHYISSGVTLQLNMGDVVNLRLPVGRRLIDDGSNYNTFSGFLLFPL